MKKENLFKNCGTFCGTYNNYGTFTNKVCLRSEADATNGVQRQVFEKDVFLANKKEINLLSKLAEFVLKLLKIEHTNSVFTPLVAFSGNFRRIFLFYARWGIITNSLT